MRILIFLHAIPFVLFSISCSTSKKDPVEGDSPAPAFQLMTLDPGHFHAALVQKMQLEGVDPTVYVYAPEGSDVQDHLNRIKGFNTRAENPTSWVEEVYTGPDFFEKMIRDKPGNIMVVSGNNAKKTEYIKKAVEAGINVLADKPMVISGDDFEMLKEAFELAEKNKVLLYDIMTERYEITTMIQKELSQIPEVFGELEKGSLENPAVTKESVHHFFKYVSGNPIKRPAWFFDVTQQGEGVVDVNTHLVDLIQWECFPEQIIDYKKDIEVLSAKRWATDLTPSMFNRVTHLDAYPDYLKKDIIKDSVLSVYSNGEINYTLKGVHAKASVIWNYEAPEGAKDTHYSIMRGTKANLIINQGAKEDYQATLYVEKTGNGSDEEFMNHLKAAIDKLQSTYPGLKVVRSGNDITISIPDKYKVGHEAHFTQVTEKYLEYLKAGKLPDWEVPNMIAKYYTTTRGYEMSR
ncbi:MAG: Gfo/Idh/MocA family oxidoreductase [Cytophagales bacterium]|nr:Gfo/Idh/MocA family oxidoreductase [Cytophagales bacterium]